MREKVVASQHVVWHSENSANLSLLHQNWLWWLSWSIDNWNGSIDVLHGYSYSGIGFRSHEPVLELLLAAHHSLNAVEISELPGEYTDDTKDNADVEQNVNEGIKESLGILWVDILEHFEEFLLLSIGVLTIHLLSIDPIKKVDHSLEFVPWVFRWRVVPRVFNWSIVIVVSMIILRVVMVFVVTLSSSVHQALVELKGESVFQLFFIEFFLCFLNVFLKFLYTFLNLFLELIPIFIQIDFVFLVFLVLVLWKFWFW